jgi:hypothetical protein
MRRREADPIIGKLDVVEYEKCGGSLYLRLLESDEKKIEDLAKRSGEKRSVRGLRRSRRVYRSVFDNRGKALKGHLVARLDLALSLLNLGDKLVSLVGGIASFCGVSLHITETALSIVEVLNTDYPSAFALSSLRFEDLAF